MSRSGMMSFPNCKNEPVRLWFVNDKTLEFLLTLFDENCVFLVLRASHVDLRACKDCRWFH